MSELDFSLYVRERTRLVNDALDRYTPAPTIHPAELHEAIRYSLFAGGKRIRPLLCLAAAEAVGGKAEDVLPTACALEMIHTFSLIHDDLPAIDNDDFRRGYPTSLKKFGEAIAVLAGDALHTLAFTTIAVHQQASLASTVINVVRCLALASGTLGMVGGQVDEHRKRRQGGVVGNASLHPPAQDRRTAERLYRVRRDPRGASAAELSALHTYGDQIGLALSDHRRYSRCHQR